MIPQADKQRVSDAIRAAEQKTTGEIFCVVADHASRYPLAPFAAAAVFALLIPLWLILLRMLLAALVILAVAHPLLNPQPHLASTGPIVLVVDDGWAAAHDWPARQAALAELLPAAGDLQPAVPHLELDVLPPHARPAAVGTGAAQRHQRHLVQLARAGTRGRSLAGGAGPARRQPAAVARRASLSLRAGRPARPGGRAG